MDNGLPIIIEIDMDYWYASARVGDLELIKIVTKNQIESLRAKSAYMGYDTCLF